MSTIDMVDSIMRYEQGDLDQQGIIDLFQTLINDGTCWRLQGHYGRMAMDLIEAGHCTRAGA